MTNIEISRWLELKYLDWQRDQGARRTIKEFAAYLGIPQTTFTNYLKGKRTPSGDHVHRIASALGSEIYALVGMIDTEDIEIRRLMSMYDHLDEGGRKKLIALAEKLTKNLHD